MTLQPASCLLIFLSITIFCADVARNQEQQASKLNESQSSHDQGHRLTACSPWKYHKYHNSSCVCGAGIHKIVVREDTQPTVYVQSCHCMSYKDSAGDHDAGPGTVVMGTCPFLCTNYFYTEIN